MSRPDRLALFEEKYTPEPMSGCWLWTGQTHMGYGYFWDGRTMARAHRWAYKRFVGDVPEGLVLDHKCRVRSCVNPDHLEPVTNQENGRRGIKVQGERHGNSRLTTEDVREIRRRVASGMTHAIAGEPFGASRIHVGHIISRRIWSHVD